MGQSVRELLVLLSPKLRAVTRNHRQGAKRYSLRAGAVFVLACAMVWAIYAGSTFLLRHVMEVELVGALIPRKLMSLVLLILVSILMISATISSFSTFFLSIDLDLLMAAPIPSGPLYFARFLEMVVTSSWMVLLFGLPVLLAFGSVYRAQWNFYLAVSLLFPALILIPCALGATVATVLTRLFSARRSRDLLVVLVVLAFIAIYLLIRALRPERLLTEDSFGTMVEFLELFRAPQSPYLPTQWMTDVLFGLLERGGSLAWLPALGVWSTAAALCAVSSWVGTALFRRAFDRAQTGRLRHGTGRTGRMRWLGPGLDRLGARLGGLTGSLLIKDLRVFLRDTNQWLQLLLLGALAAVYVLNFSYLKLVEFSWFTLYTINHAMVGLVLAGVAVRFVFPAVSLEGRAWWIVSSAPMRLATLMHSKLLIHFLPLASLGVLLSLISCAVIEVPLAFGVISIGLVLTASLCVSAIGVGLGAVFPKFDAENPSKIPAGVGGVSFMIASMSFVLLFVLASVYPIFVLYRWPFRPAEDIGRPGWLTSSLLALVLMPVLACWLPMWLGHRCLSRRED